MASRIFLGWSAAGGVDARCSDTALVRRPSRRVTATTETQTGRLKILCPYVVRALPYIGHGNDDLKEPTALANHRFRSANTLEEPRGRLVVFDVIVQDWTAKVVLVGNYDLPPNFTLISCERRVERSDSLICVSLSSAVRLLLPSNNVELRTKEFLVRQMSTFSRRELVGNSFLSFLDVPKAAIFFDLTSARSSLDVHVAFAIKNCIVSRVAVSPRCDRFGADETAVLSHDVDRDELQDDRVGLVMCTIYSVVNESAGYLLVPNDRTIKLGQTIKFGLNQRILVHVWWISFASSYFLNLAPLFYVALAKTRELPFVKLKIVTVKESLDVIGPESVRCE